MSELQLFHFEDNQVRAVSSNGIILGDVTDEELQELINIGFDTDEVEGDKTWIHWEHKNKPACW
jgi:hypothetical protein